MAIFNAGWEGSRRAVPGVVKTAISSSFLPSFLPSTLSLDVLRPFLPLPVKVSSPIPRVVEESDFARGDFAGPNLRCGKEKPEDRLARGKRGRNGKNGGWRRRVGI